MGRRAGWILAPAAAGVLLLSAGSVSGVAAERGSAARLAAETPGRVVFEVAGDVSPVRGRWRVDKVRGGSPWLFTRYLPEGLVAAGPFATSDGEVALEFALWDPGRYRLTYQTEGAGGISRRTGSVTLQVRPEPVKTRNTLLLFAGLTVLGLAAGFAAGNLRRPGGRNGRPAPGLTVLAVTAAVTLALPGTAGWAAGHDHGHAGMVQDGAAHVAGAAPPAAGAAGGIRWTPAAPTVQEPVRIRVDQVGEGLRLAVTRDEDGLVLLRQNLPAWSGPAEWVFVFPDGTRYTLAATAANRRERAGLGVSALPPDGGQQFRSLATMLFAYTAAALIGFGAARRRSRLA